MVSPCSCDNDSERRMSGPAATTAGANALPVALQVRRNRLPVAFYIAGCELMGEGENYAKTGCVELRSLRAIRAGEAVTYSEDGGCGAGIEIEPGQQFGDVAANRAWAYGERVGDLA